MAFTEDLSEFMDTDDGFAITVTIAAVSRAAVFVNAPAEAFGMVAGTQPMLVLPSADVAAVARGDAVVANGTNYTVAKIDNDGTGMARVILEKA
jgi:hypothetical protein